MPATPFDKFEAVNKLLDFQLDRDFVITKQDASIDKARAVAKKIEDFPPMFTLYKNQFNGIDNDQRLGYMKSKIRISLLNYKLRFVLALLQTLFVQSAALANEYFLLKKIRNRFANNKFSTVDRVDYLLSLWKKKAEAETR